MTNSLTVAILAGLGSMLGWGISNFFAKKSVNELSAVAFTFWLQLISLVSIAFYVPFSPVLERIFK